MSILVSLNWVVLTLRRQSKHRHRSFHCPGNGRRGDLAGVVCQQLWDCSLVSSRFGATGISGGRPGGFDREMVDTSLSLLNQLALHPDRLRPAIEGVSHSLPYLEAYSPDLGEDRRYKRRTASVTLTLLLVVWCVQVVAYFNLDPLPLYSAMLAGIRSVVIMFCCSCFPAYVWVDLLHRKPTGVALIAAALCLSWCAAGLYFPAIRF
jgi:hypothetical protein